MSNNTVSLSELTFIEVIDFLLEEQEQATSDIDENSVALSEEVLSEEVMLSEAEQELYQEYINQRNKATQKLEKVNNLLSRFIFDEYAMKIIKSRK